jgi:hypothetical protein
MSDQVEGIDFLELIRESRFFHVDGASLNADGTPALSRADSSAAHRNFPPRVQRALGWTVACDELGAQPAWGA